MNEPKLSPNKWISFKTTTTNKQKQNNRHAKAGLDCNCPLSFPINHDRCCERGKFMEAITAKVKLMWLLRRLLLLQCLRVFVSGKIPPLHWDPCGCGLGKRHSNALVTQRRGNCKCFLHNCAFVPLPGGYWASQEPNNTPELFEQTSEGGSTAQPTVYRGPLQMLTSLYRESVTVEMKQNYSKFSFLVITH